VVQLSYKSFGIGAAARRGAAQSCGEDCVVKTLTVKCPHCAQVSKIFLSTNACVIILNCPSCYTPIMYFDRKIFLLSKNQIEAIKNNSQDSAVMRMLHRIAKTEMPMKDSAKKAARSYHAIAESAVSCIPVYSKGEKYITDDDVTNLRIELELCKDSGEFINRI
jgi:hypothetical protein